MSWKKYNENDHHEEEAIDLDSREKVKKPEKQKSHYKEVYATFAKFMNVPLNWSVNKTQQRSAENLYTERGLEKIERALAFYEEHKDGEYCPRISSPFDLDSKWSSLYAFKTKQGL